MLACILSARDLIASETEPSTFEEAMRSPSASAWKTAMETEIASMRNLEVWSVIPRSEATRVIPCRWIFKVKRHADGTIERHKARLVAKGCCIVTITCERVACQTDHALICARKVPTWNASHKHKHNSSIHATEIDSRVRPPKSANHIGHS
jgi:hypothetical protein